MHKAGTVPAGAARSDAAASTTAPASVFRLERRAVQAAASRASNHRGSVANHSRIDSSVASR